MEHTLSHFSHGTYSKATVSLAPNFIEIHKPPRPHRQCLDKAMSPEGVKPSWVDEFFQSVKILSMTSFRREVKPWVPCRRFTACKRTSSTAVEQVVACALVTQRARVRSPVRTGFLGEVFSGFFLTCKTNIRKL